MFRKRKKEIEDADPWKAFDNPTPPAQSRTPPGAPKGALKAAPASPSRGDLGARLRAEMLPASQASPRFKALRPRVKPSRILTLLVLLVLAGLAWFFGLGPGRPSLEKGLVHLVSLARQVAAPTPTVFRPTATSVPPTITPTVTLTATPWPTRTATLMIPLYTPTITSTSTLESACQDFSTITLEYVGQELCVQGTVLRVIENPGNTLIVFSDQPGALYLVTYDVLWPEGTIGACYQVTGEIQRLLNNPVIIFGYNNLPTECP